MKILNIYNSISNTTIPYELEQSMRKTYKEDCFSHLCINRIIRLLKNFWKIYQVFKKNDIVHTHHTFSSVVTSFYRILFIGRGKIFFCTVHRDFSTFSLSNSLVYILLIFPFRDKIICNSYSTKSALPWHIKLFSSKKIEVIYNGVNLSEIKPLINFPGNKSNIIKLINIGRLIQDKDQMTLIKMCSNLSKKKINYHLTICGDGPLHEVLNNEIVKRGLTNRITLLGNVERSYVYRLLRESSICISTSLTEGFGNSDVEAMAAGCPIVVTDIPVRKEITNFPQLTFNAGQYNELSNIVINLSNDEDNFKDAALSGLNKSKEFSLLTAAKLYKYKYYGKDSLQKKIALITNSIAGTSVPAYWVKESKKLTSKEFQISILPVNLRNVRNISEALSCDIIQCHHYKSALIVLLASFFMFKSKSKFVFVSQGSYLFLSSINKLISYIIFIFFSHIVFVNRELYVQYNKISKKLINTKYSVIFNAVGEIKDLKNNKKILDKYNIDSQRLIIFNPARTVVEKNQIRLLESIKILSAKNKSILLVVAGDGIMFNKLSNYIKNNKLENNVLLLGEIPRDDVLSFYSITDVYCMPSISEGLNTTYLEAIQAKIKIVVSDIPQFTYPLKCKKLNPKNLTIRYTNPCSASDIASAIEASLLDKNKSKLTKFPFLLSDMFLEYDMLYQKI